MLELSDFVNVNVQFFFFWYLQISLEFQKKKNSFNRFKREI